MWGYLTGVSGVATVLTVGGPLGNRICVASSRR
jgi:hypothetical protein